MTSPSPTCTIEMASLVMRHDDGRRAVGDPRVRRRPGRRPPRGHQRVLGRSRSTRRRHSATSELAIAAGPSRLPAMTSPRRQRTRPRSGCAHSGVAVPVGQIATVARTDAPLGPLQPTASSHPWPRCRWVAPVSLAVVTSTRDLFGRSWRRNGVVRRVEQIIVAGHSDETLAKGRRHRGRRPPDRGDDRIGIIREDRAAGHFRDR